MRERLKKIPHPGWRNIKTALSVVLCLLLYHVTGQDGVLMALIAAILCMQDSVDKSLRLGIDRMKGTALGGLIGVGISLLELTALPYALFLLCIFVAVVLFIFLCNLIRSRSSIVIGCFVFLTIVLESGDLDNIYLGAINRTLSTFIGIGIALVVNRLIFRPTPERFRGKNTVNPVFHYEIHEAKHLRRLKMKANEVAELYIYPEDTVWEDKDFDLRLTRNVSRIPDYTLARFPGYKRLVMLLDGEMYLRHDYEDRCQHEVDLAQYEVDCFKGEWDTACRGLETDLSLVVKDHLSAAMTPISVPDIFTMKNDRMESLYILEDDLKLCFKSEGKEYRETVSKGDFVIVSWFANGQTSYTLSLSHSSLEPGTVAAVRISSWQD